MRIKRQFIAVDVYMPHEKATLSYFGITLTSFKRNTGDKINHTVTDYHNRSSQPRVSKISPGGNGKQPFIDQGTY